MTKTSSRTKYTLLGMLSIKPMTGYEIAKLIEQSTHHFWSESEGQIYPALALCVKEELATYKEMPSKKNQRNKKIYSITSKGKKVLNEWLKKAVQPTLVRDELLLKIFFGRNNDKKDNIHHITIRQKEIENTINIYKDIKNDLLNNRKDSPHLKYWLLTLDYGIKEAKAVLAWCKESIKLLETS